MKKTLYLPGLIIFLWLLAFGLHAQTLTPYLQTPTPTSIWISWKTASGTESKVIWGTTSGNLNNTTNGTNQSITDNGYSGGYNYHTVKVDGLTPYTKYYYKIQTGTETSTEFSFRTSPDNGAEVNGHIKIVVVGDNQLKDEPRYDSIMVRIKRKLVQRFGSDYNDSIQFILMCGDQVDIGTLDHYENTHLNKTKYLSGYLPIMTAVGNHETYGSQNLALYSKHFVLDDNMSYQGISSNSEYYYAFEVGRVLFIQTSTEHTSGATGTAQTNWVSNVLNASKTDDNIDFVVVLGHRPYTCEQYVGDISGWIRTTVMPMMATNPKCVLEIGAHHHLYHRGQLKDSPIYNMISGGTAWDQYWGMSTETDDIEVQKTLSQWPYQIIDFNVATKTMSVETYSVGSIFGWKESQLIDQFHRTFGKSAPDKPSVTNTFSGQVTLPLTINSSAYTTSTNELYNSTQFQVSLSTSFVSIEKELLRDYENYFGIALRKDSTLDQNKDVNIFAYTLPANSLANGTHYVRVRHRDRNLNWSAWSDPVAFEVTGSVLSASPAITIPKYRFTTGEVIPVSFTNGPGHTTDWIGLYKKGDVPGPTASTSWQYVSGTHTANAANQSGVINVSSTTVGEYFLAFFESDGYTEIAPRINNVYIGPAPDVLTDRETYNTGELITANYTNAPNAAGDLICIYKIGMNASTDVPLYSAAVTGTSGSTTFTINTKAYYFVVYKYKGTLEISNHFSFSVGNQIAVVSTDKSLYDLNEDIVVTFADGPGIAKDWMGLYHAGDDPNMDPLYSYNYVAGAPAGITTFTDDKLPVSAGDYFVVFFTNDSYNEISNRALFTVVDNTTTGVQYANDNKNMMLYPNPMGSASIVKTTYPIETLEILDIQGNVLYRAENVYTTEFRIVKENIPSGMYYVKVQAEKLYTLKLIIE